MLFFLEGMQKLATPVSKAVQGQLLMLLVSCLLREALWLLTAPLAQVVCCTLWLCGFAGTFAQSHGFSSEPKEETTRSSPAVCWQAHGRTAEHCSLSGSGLLLKGEDRVAQRRAGKDLASKDTTMILQKRSTTYYVSIILLSIDFTLAWALLPEGLDFSSGKSRALSVFYEGSLLTLIAFKCHSAA